MRLQIDKESEVPVHAQLREQIIFQIGTGELMVGQMPPSVRELARELKIHHNTVSHVFAELVREGWLVKRRGSRLVVVEPRQHDRGDFKDLDDLIDRTIRLATDRGFSLRQLAGRVRKRLLEGPPDHLLVIEPERAMGALMQEEIRAVIGYSPVTCTMPMLLNNPSLAIGAVLLVPSYFVDGLKTLPSKNRTVVTLTYSRPDQLVAAVRGLKHPSVIGLVSVSVAGLKTVNGHLAAVIGKRHSTCEFLMDWPTNADGAGRAIFRHYTMKDYPKRPPAREWATSVRKSAPESLPHHGLPGASMADIQACDLLICDSITYEAVKHPCRVLYQLLSDKSLTDIAVEAKSLRLGTNRQKAVRKISTARD